MQVWEEQWTGNYSSKTSGRTESVTCFLVRGLFMTQGVGWLRLKVFWVDMEHGEKLIDSLEDKPWSNTSDYDTKVCKRPCILANHSNRKDK